ncbi:MAG: hypothetical protein ABF805_08805, partial [Bifidobacterium sp.]
MTSTTAVKKPTGEQAPSKKTDTSHHASETTHQPSDAEREVDALVTRGLVALKKFEDLNQEQVDHIVAKASIAALNKHLVLAK